MSFMCGRYVLSISEEEVKRLFDLEEVDPRLVPPR